MASRTHRAVLGASAIAALSLTACGASFSIGEHLNSPNKAIMGILNPTPKSVSCPSNISDKAGTKFTCNVVAANGAKDTIDVLEYQKGHIKIVAINGKPVGAQTSSKATGTGTSTGTSTGASTGTGTGTSTGASTNGTATTGTATTKG